MAFVSTHLVAFVAALATAVGGGADAAPDAASLVAARTYTPPPVYPVLSDLKRTGIEGTNPSLAQKVLGYDAWVTAHGGPPDTLILGTSRSVMLDPAEIARRTKATAYNAGISNGAAREFLTMTGFADLRSPGHLPQLVLLLDVESFDGRATTQRVRDYQQRIVVTRAACADPADCSVAWMRSARSIAADARARQNGGRPYRETQLPNGKQINGVLDKLERQGADLGALQDRRIAERVRSYTQATATEGANPYDHLYPIPKEHFRRFLQLANARGQEPIIVLTGMLPKCIRICGPAGWNARRAEVRAYLAALGTRYDFTFADLSFPSTWRGSSADFFDEIHLRPSGASKVVTKLIALGAFRRGTNAG
ncbi:MAG: hypothetical protein JWN72_2533 [Thermoleophilia bacterium]|nr:hypothetical protein [Thermoleophilia bacterium]